MKIKLTSFLSVILTVLLATTFSSCEKDDDNDQAPAQQGSNSPKMPKSITIAKFTIQNFPQLDNGNFWDLSDNSGPELYFYITKDDGKTFVYEQEQSDYFTNAKNTEEYSLIPTNPILISEPTEIYKYELYDYDDVGNDDLMVEIQEQIYKAGDPHTTPLFIETSKVKIKLDVQYQF